MVASLMADVVTCPVCGVEMRATEAAMNDHLDSCLNRGVKRKLTQRTLFQLNFSPPISQQSSNKSNHNEGALDLPSISVSKNPSIYEALSSPSTLQTKIPKCDVSPESPDDSTSSGDYSPASAIGSPTANDVEGMILETYIVGRKFSNERIINQGSIISLSRDPNNPKDPNAVHVTSPDSKILGFLPRELARFISPLIENFNLEFEGTVAIQNTNPFDPTPIHLRCRKVSFHDMDHSYIESLSSLWVSVLTAVRNAKNLPPKGVNYKRNFRTMVHEVLTRNNHLFSSDEVEYFGSLESLPDDCQRLLVRLYTRKGPWFRLMKISYPEVADVSQAVNLLNVANYMEVVENVDQLREADFDEILDLLSVYELREIAGLFKKNCGVCARKRDLISMLSSDKLCTSLQTAVLARVGTCIQLSGKIKTLVRRVERVFFLNQEQDLSTFLIADIGIIKYPAYKCLSLKPIFSTRAHLLSYEEAVELMEKIEEFIDNDDRESVLRSIETAESQIKTYHVDEELHTFHGKFSPSWVYARVLFLGTRFLERMHRYKDAIVLLKLLTSRFPSHNRRGCWMLRLSVNLEHIKCMNESLEVAEEALNDPFVRAGTKSALQQRVLRLGKPPRRWKVPSFAAASRRRIPEVKINGRPLNSVTGVKSRFYGEDGDQCGVEELALRYYSGDEGGEWNGIHTESGVWLTIFALLMWDITFSDMPDVFHNRFQTAPLDFGTETFYSSRDRMIEERLEKIRNGSSEEILVTSWQKNHGTACRGLNWEKHTLCELRAAVSCTGGQCLASLVRHLAKDYNSWKSGMPDLLLWRFHGRYGGEAKLVEVKGPRDTLSFQQRAWLLQLMDCGFSVEVCKVTPP